MSGLSRGDERQWCCACDANRQRVERQSDTRVATASCRTCSDVAAQPQKREALEFADASSLRERYRTVNSSAGAYVIAATGA